MSGKQSSLPPAGPGPHSKEEIFEWFAAHRLRAVIRVENGEERLFVGSRDPNNPLPAGFYLALRPHMEEFTALVKRSDTSVCEDPTNALHSDSYREDTEGHRYCHTCATI